MNIEDFLALHGNPSGLILPHFTTLEEAWDHADPVVLTWIATRPGVLSPEVLEEFLAMLGAQPDADPFRAALDAIIAAQALMAARMRQYQAAFLRQHKPLIL